MPPAVTIVILNYNGKKFLEQFLPSVLATDYENFEILLADNASTDESISYVEKTFPQVKLLKIDKNYGFTGGNNRAVEIVTSPYYVLLNSDVEVDKGWLRPLVERMESDKMLAAVQPKLLAFHQKDHFEYAGAAGGMIDRYGYPFCRGRLFDTCEKDEGQFESYAEIFWATGACCIIRKEVTDKLGLFEEEFFAHMEEIDFCWRAKNHGWKIGYEPKSIVYHVGGGTLHKSNPRKTFLNVRNSLVVLIKNTQRGKVFGKAFIRAVLDGVWGVRSLLRFDFATIGAIIKGHFAVWFRLHHWLRKRYETYPDVGKIPAPGAGFYHRSIVFQYFFGGRKRVRDLKD